MRKILNYRAFFDISRSLPPRLLIVSLAITAGLSTTQMSDAFANRFPANAPRPEPAKLLSAQSLAREGKSEQGIRQLNSLINSETDKSKRSVTRMALAVLHFEAGRDEEAIAQFKFAIADGSRIPDYAHLHLGLLFKKKDRLKEAKTEFENTLALKPPSTTANEAMFHLGEIHLAEKNWRSAAAQFQKLLKLMRGHEKHPSVVHHLMRAELNSGRRTPGCKWAREMYSKYPTHPLVASWSSALEDNIVDSKKTNCRATTADLSTRIRRLWLGGAAERAGAELRSLKQKAGVDAYSVDALLANHLISEGQVDEALKILLAHYPTQRNRTPYLGLLAKAASRAGDYQASIAAYQKSFDLAPRGREAASALFQAAFTSYQIQDYDGATRRFEKLVKSFPSSRLAGEARWHLAWMRYLRADYSGAHESFTALTKVPKYKTVRRGRRRIRVAIAAVVAPDRLRYWSAMSLLNMKKTQEALPLLHGLVRDPAMGYYSVLAYYRIKSIPQAQLPAGIESRLGLKNNEAPATPTEEELQNAAVVIAVEKEAFARTVANPEQAAESAGASESGDSADTSGSQQRGVASVGAATEGDAADVEAVDVDAVAAAEEDVEVEVETFADEQMTKGLREAGLAVRFERARDLSLVGLLEPARRELQEIEKRAKSNNDRQILINEYIEVRNYERASYIGEIGFGSSRLRDGLKGEGRKFWEFAYPRAWEPVVVKAHKSTNVAEELIWSIMRAESHYRQTAQSPVGALGLMQIMPFTGRRVASLLNINSFESRSLLEPETNIQLGSRYLQRLSENFKGSVPLVAAGYNAGPHRVHAWVHNFGTLDMDEFIEHIPFVETRNYVKRVVRNYQIYSLLYKNGGPSLKWLIQPVGVELTTPVPTSEVW